jgi:hypothetical protein
MKKFVVLIVVLAMALAGCCTRTDTAGVTTKNFPNCMLAAQAMVCNPDANVMAVINAVAPILANLVNTAIPGSALFINASNAQNVVKSIQGVGCTSVTALNQLIAFIQSSDFAQAQMQLAAKGKRMATSPIDVGPLINWRNTGK